MTIIKGPAVPVIPTVRTAVNATAITMGLHGLCTVAMVVPGLLAPVAAADFGANASMVGVFMAIIYLGIIPASLGSGAVLARWGDLRSAQWTGVLCALSMALIALAGWTGQWLGGGATTQPALVLALMTLLLFAAGMSQGLGYGMINPIGSQILFRATPPAIRSFVFSIKQSAVPIGQMIAGLLIPSLLLVFGWQSVVFCVALMILAYTIAMFWMRLATSEVPLSPQPAPAAATHGQHGQHSGQRGGLRAALTGFVAPARIVWATPSLRELAWVGVLYSANQLCLVSFLVSYLNLEIGLSLVLAGSLFSASQFGGMIGRVTWGYAADRWVTPRMQLGVLGIIGGVCGVLTTLFTAQWPIVAIAVVSVVYGATAASWNGVYFAEVARLSQREFPRDDSGGQVGRITGGLQFYMSLGAGIGPLLFSGLVGLIGTYSTGFAVFALPSLLFGVRLMLRRDVSGQHRGAV
jgi:MFS family permease